MLPVFHHISCRKIFATTCMSKASSLIVFISLSLKFDRKKIIWSLLSPFCLFQSLKLLKVLVNKLNVAWLSAQFPLIYRLNQGPLFKCFILLLDCAGFDSLDNLSPTAWGQWKKSFCSILHTIEQSTIMTSLNLLSCLLDLLCK